MVAVSDGFERGWRARPQDEWGEVGTRGPLVRYLYVLRHEILWTTNFDLSKGLLLALVLTLL